MNEYQDRITGLQDEIARIKSSGTGRKNTRLNEILVREREYQLSKDQAALQSLQAKRDWQIAKDNLAQNRERNTLERANLFGYEDIRYKGSDGKWHTKRVPTLGARQLDESIRSNQADETIREDTVASNEQIRKDATATNQKAMAQERKETAAKYVDALMTPGSQTVTYTRYDPIPEADLGLYDQKDLIPRIVNGKTVYFKATKVTESIQSATINDPSQIYQYLISHAIPPAVAKWAVITRFQLPKDWKPGDPITPKNPKKPMPKDQPAGVGGATEVTTSETSSGTPNINPQSKHVWKQIGWKFGRPLYMDEKTGEYWNGKGKPPGRIK